MTYSPKTNHLAHFLKRFIYLGSAVILLCGFLLSAKAAASPVTFSGITSTGGSTSGSTHTTSASVVNVTGSIASSATVTSLTSYSDYPSSSTNLVWTKGTNTFTDTITFNPLLESGRSFTITYRSYAASGYLPDATFTITKSGSASTSTSVTCAVSGTVRNTTGTALPNATVVVGATGSITSSKTTDSSGNYSTSIATTVDNYVSATASLSGYSSVNNWNQAKATPSPCNLKLDIYLTATGASSPTTGGSTTTSTTPSKPAQLSVITLSGKTKLTSGAILPGVTVSVSTKTATYSSSPSGADGSYSIPNISAWSGTSLTFNGTKTGYTFSAPISYVMPYNSGGFTSDVYMAGGSGTSSGTAHLEGTVYKKYGAKTEPLVGANVSLECHDGTPGTTGFSNHIYQGKSDGSGHYQVNADLSHPSCNGHAEFIVGKDVLNALKSPNKIIRITSAVVTQDFVIDTTADLTINATYPELRSNFQRVDNTYQPDTTGDRVAFDMTLTQGGKLTKIKPSDQKSGPYHATNLDATVPFTVHADKNQNHLGNKAFDSDSPQSLKAGPNAYNAVIKALAPNSITVNVNDKTGVTGTMTCVEINPAPRLTDQRCSSGDSSRSSYSFDRIVRESPRIFGGNGSRNVVFFPKTSSFPIVVHDGAYSTDKLANSTSSFDDYFGNQKTVDIAISKRPTSDQFVIRGEAQYRFSFARNSWGIGASNVQITFVAKNAGTDPPDQTITLGNTTTGPDGSYSFAFKEDQLKGKSKILMLAQTPDGAKDAYYARLREEATWKSDENRYVILRSFSFTENPPEGTCVNHASELGAVSKGINQIWFCSDEAKNMYSDTKYAWVWSTIINQITTLRSKYTKMNGSATSAPTPPEIIINSEPLVNAAAMSNFSLSKRSSCWPPSTPNVVGDEPDILITTGIIKTIYVPDTSSDHHLLRAVTTHETSHLYDHWLGGCHKMYSKDLSADSFSSSWLKIKNAYEGKQTIVDKLIANEFFKTVTESTYMGFGGHPLSNEQETFASLFSLINLNKADLDARINALYIDDPDNPESNIELTTKLKDTLNRFVNDKAFKP